MCPGTASSAAATTPTRARSTPATTSTAASSRGGSVRARGIFVSIATVGLMVGPAFAHGLFSTVAGARTECTITGTAADDDLNGTTHDDVIYTKAASGSDDAGSGNDVIRGEQET